MTKVCHISTVHSVFDGRIFHKQCISLSNAGYDVTLMVPHIKNEQVYGVNIVALKKFNSRVLRVLFAPLLVIPKVLKSNYQVIQIHDPELLLVGVLFKLLGKKTIFDSHENVSAQIESKSWLGGKLMRHIVKFFYRQIEKFCLLFFDRIISVTPEITRFLAPKKGVLVRNYPIISKIDNAPFERLNKGEFVLVYVGGLTRIRGIKEVCLALQKIKKNVKLLLVGEWQDESYKSECMSLSNNIEYIGSVPLAEVYSVMKTADVGIATLYPEQNYLGSLPIKAFEYMACGLPIMMSNFPYWIQEFDGCAEFVDPFNVQEIANTIIDLATDKEKCLKLGENGKKAVLKKYSWEAEAKKLVEMYEEVLK